MEACKFAYITQWPKGVAGDCVPLYMQHTGQHNAKLLNMHVLQKIILKWKQCQLFKRQTVSSLTSGG